MPTQVQRTASARRRLLDAATSLVAEQGVNNTSVAAIGERAGMSRGAVNFHFGSKDDLLTAVAEEVTSDFETQAWAYDVPEGLAWDDGIRAVMVAHGKDVQADPERFRIFAMLFFESLGPSPHLHEHFAALHRRIRQGVVDRLAPAQEAGIIKGDVDLAIVASHLVGAYRGISFQYILDPDAIDVVAAFGELGESIVCRLTL
jgi:AcrR family transcriptional regulator